MNLNELDNEEVLFMYFGNRKWLDEYEDIFKHKSIIDTIDILDFGNVSVTRYITDEDIDKIKESKHYTYALMIDEKLSPIADMIGDIDSNLFNKIKDCFENIQI
jgi:hypothetical protein